MRSSKKQKPKTVVLDTNVWISAMVWGGTPSKIIRLAEDKKITILISDEIVSEINQTLKYQKISQIYQEIGLTRQQLIESVLQISKLTKTEEKIGLIQQDPTDNKFIECASVGNADYLISGDKHLLRMHLYKKTQILSAKEFLKTLS
jgi:putative PIN family toxin of toxin-antitoxin system